MIGAVALLPGLMATTSIADVVARATPCPDVEVVFARGTNEGPGIGGIGQPFVDSLKAQAGSRSVGVYAVDYPASSEFATSAPAGAADATAYIEATAQRCPNTQIVMGGYSQGAAVMDYATNDMPTEIADRVAAIALFGAPRTTFATSLIGRESPAIAAPYASKTVDLCVPHDPICFEGGNDVNAHVAYAVTGMTQQAATFVAGRL